MGAEGRRWERVAFMTTGFQQQQPNFGPILRSAQRPQHVGQAPDRRPAETPRTFSPARAQPAAANAG